MAQVEKVCRRCLSALPEGCFGVSRRHADGRNSVCLPCHREYQRVYYHANHARLLDRNRAYVAENKLLLNRKRRIRIEAKKGMQNDPTF